jgi:hypothetical protein
MFFRFFRIEYVAVGCGWQRQRKRTDKYNVTLARPVPEG